MKSQLKWVGNFLFKHRNFVFPSVILAAFVFFAPPDKTFGSERLERWKDLIAIAIAMSGVGLRTLTLSFNAVPRSGVAKRVDARELFTGGLFGACRNPLYVGNMLIYSGIFLMHGDIRVIIGGTLVFAFFYLSIIHAEEAYLAERFGADYADYCARVPRWAFDLRLLPASLRRSRFNLTQGLLIDYNPAANAICALAGIEIYETLYDEGAAGHHVTLIAWSILILTTLIAARGMRQLKKRLRRIEAAAG